MIAFLIVSFKCPTIGPLCDPTKYCMSKIIETATFLHLKIIAGRGGISLSKNLRD